MEREVHYCTTEDGVRIAYCVEGDGPPVLFSHHVFSFSLSHIVPTFNEVLRGIGRGRQLIRYDVRGIGLSQRNVEDLSPGSTIRDIEAVVADLGLAQFTLLGAAFGAPRAIEYAALHPDQVARLVLYTAFARMEDAWPGRVLQAFAQLARANWDLASYTFADAGVRRQNEEEGRRWAELLRRSVSGETMARLAEAYVGLDVTHLLGEITCPTIVCHAVNGIEYPFVLGERLAEAIPGARLVTIEGEVSGAFTNAQATIDGLEGCLPEPLVPRPLQRAATEITATRLTPREAQILPLLAAGLTSKEIAYKLSLSIRTVGRHITNIYDKIGARTRAEATAYAMRNGLTEE